MAERREAGPGRGVVKNARPRLGLTLLFLSILLFQAAVGSGGVFSYDEVVLFETAAQLVDHGTASLSYSPEVAEYSRRGRDGRLYSKFGMAMSAYLIPWYAAGKGLAALAGWRDTEAYGCFLASFANAPVIAAIAVLFLLTLRDLASSPRAAWLTTMLLAFATTLAVYGRGLFADALTGLAVLAAFRYYLADRPPLSGIATAIAFLTRLEYVIMAPFYALRFGGRRGRWWKFLMPVLLLGLLVGVYNFARFGSPINQGQLGNDPYDVFDTPLHVGLYGLFLSPGKGLLWYSPPILLALVGLPEFWRRHRRETITLSLVLVPLVAVHALWHSWMGGWSYGPRRLVALLPLLMLPAYPAVERLLARTPGRIALAFLGLAGFGMQLGGLTVNFMRYIATCPSFSATLWTVRYSAAFGQLRHLWRTGAWDIWYVKIGRPGPAALVFGLVLLGLSLLCALLSARHLAHDGAGHGRVHLGEDGGDASLGHATE